MAVCLRTHNYSPTSRWYRLSALLVAPFLYFNRFDNVKSANKLPEGLPVLVCMSRADKTIPWRQSAKLADFIGHEKRFLSPVGGHDDFAWAQEAVVQFLHQL